MKDVARLAGVSTATVSHVLNNSRFVSETVRQQVYDAVKKIDYTPNQAARSLRTSQTRMIGVILWDNLNYYFQEIFHWINQYSIERDYFTVVSSPPLVTVDCERSAITRLMNKGVDGLILNVISRDEEIMGFLGELKLPYVLMNRNLGLSNGSVVHNDDFLGGSLALDHLLESGHRRIGMIAFNAEDSNYYNKRLDAYFQKLKAAGLKQNRHYVYYGNGKGSDGEKALEHFTSLDHPPSALFCTTDQLALELYNAAYKRGIRIPEDLSIIGFDDLKLSGYFTPPLTTVAQNKEVLAEKAVNLLLQKIENPEQPNETVCVAPHLVIRESTRPFSE